MKKVLLLLIALIAWGVQPGWAQRGLGSAGSSVGRVVDNKTHKEGDINLAYKYFNADKYEQAAAEFEKVLPIVKEEYGEYDTTIYSSYLLFTAYSNLQIRRYNSAIEYYSLIKEIYEYHNDTLCNMYLLSITRLAFLHKTIGDYIAAEELYLKELQIKAIISGETHPDYISLLNDLAIFYNDIGEYSKAELLFLQAIQIIKEVLGETHPNYLTSLDNLAILYEDMVAYPKAVTIYQQVLQIRKEVLGESHPDYATSLDNLASIYDDLGEFNKAQTLYQQALQIRKETLGENHPDYASTLNNLALLYFNTGNFIDAEPLFIKSLQIRKSYYGDFHPNYAASLNNLALLYYKKGEYKSAEELYKQAIQILESSSDDNQSDYATYISNLAVLYLDIGFYMKAEPLFKQVLQLRMNTLGMMHPEYSVSLNNMANLYQLMGAYLKAEQYYLQAIQSISITKGETHPDYASYLNNLAFLYLYIGSFDKAEILLIKSLGIRKDILGESHPDCATSLNNLALLYGKLGDYEKEESLLIQSLQIISNSLGAAHPSYATSASNLANLYLNIGEFAKAESLFNQSKEIIQEVFGVSHPFYAGVLNNLANLYYEIGDYLKAESLFNQSKEIRQEVFGVSHPDFAYSLHNLALLNHKIGKYLKSEQLYYEAIQIHFASLGESHPSSSAILNNLALLYESMGNYVNAEKLFLQTMKSTLTQMNQSFFFLSEAELEKVMGKLKNNFEAYNSFYHKYYPQEPKVAEPAYDIELATKGMILNASVQMRQAILSSGDSLALEKYEAWSTLRNMLAKQYALPIAERRMNTDSLEAAAEVLEKELTRMSTAFREATSLTSTRWQDVQQGLGDGEAAIEFTSFQYRNDEDWTDSTLYAALIIRKGWEHPKMVYLFEQRQIDSLLDIKGSNDHQIASLYTRGAVPVSTTSTTSHTGLYDLVWAPLDSLLQGVSTVYYAPSGSLHRIAFDAIADDNGQYLSDRYVLHRLNTTAALLSRDTVKFRPQSMTLFGGIDYTIPDREWQARVSATASTDSILAMISTRSLPTDLEMSGTWGYLPGTATEVAAISQLAGGYRITTTTYTGADATEERFKAVTGTKAPEVIHIASHGFFFPDPEKESAQELNRRRFISDESGQVYKRSANPLMRSGLLMAGANRAWSGESVPYGMEDGILAAYEVAGLPLHNTKLVVLSACETGLGDIRGSEGVFGLQRAFRAAGVKYLIMSLWKVPDEETAMFMERFYATWLEGSSIPEAFRATQKSMKKLYPNEPYKWAGFVLVE